MTYASRSSHVVGTHFFARFGYEEAMGTIASKLAMANKEEHAFWKAVMDEVEKIYVEESEGRRPCAALPISPQLEKRRNFKDVKNL